MFNSVLLVMEDLINTVNELYELEVKNQPFDILNSLGIHENNHSRLLCALLKHQNKALLKSFIKNVLGKDIEFGKDVKITALKYYIDILIKDKNYAIVIENKICWASDRDGQLLDYIDSVKKMGIKEDNIYAVYLTADNSQEIGYEVQLADKHFIKKTYLDNIIPWLQEINNEVLKLDDYIDYVNNYIKNRTTEIKFFEKVFNILKQKNDLKHSLQLFSSKYKDKYWVINKEIYDYVIWMINNELYNSLSSLFSEPYYNDVTRFRKHNNGKELYILFFKREWNNKWYIHFEYIFDVEKQTFRLELHFESYYNNIVDEIIQDPSLSNIIKKQRRKKSVYYTKQFSLNDDLTINDNDKTQLSSDIQRITEYLDNKLIKKK